MSNHFGALEADFLREYDLDLREVLWGEKGLGVRRILSLVEGLPPGSALHRSVDPDGWSWTNQEELLAVVCELVDLNSRLFIQANSKKGARMPKPLRVPRPNAEKPEPTTSEQLKVLMRDQGTPVIVSSKED